MIPVRQSIGGIGNLMFKQAYLYGQLRDGLIPDLYVQSQKYWEKYKDEIRALFGDGIGDVIDERVALQIRRGDYLNNRLYVQLFETDYYQKAVKEFPDSKFLVFCHDNQNPEQDAKDKEWAKSFLDTFIKGRYEINEPTTESEDMNKMANCKGKIIANSTFGWWSAFLGMGKVVVPKQWFTDGLQRCDLLDEWIKI